MRDLKGKLRRLAAKAIKWAAPLVAEAVAKEVKRRVSVPPAEKVTATRVER